MNIKALSITSPTSLNFDLNISTPVVFICGRYSDLVLDLIRESIGDYGAEQSPDRIDDGRFVIHSDIEIDGRDYSLCYIRNADFMGDNRLAAGFSGTKLDFSETETLELLAKFKGRNSDSSNILKRTAALDSGTDDRPIFLYDYFDRLDEAVDPMPIVDELVASGRQVFVSVCKGYPTERLTGEGLQVLKI